MGNLLRPLDQVSIDTIQFINSIINYTAIMSLVKRRG